MHDEKISPGAMNPGGHHPEEAKDHGHDFDGIRELDNKLPNWWLATFFATVVFGYGYWMRYHVFEAPTSLQRLEQAQLERAKRENAMPVSDDAILALSKDPAQMTKARSIFLQQCVACHGTNGQGIIGPNLTDDYWLHGDRPSQIFATVRDGVPVKGMPTWGPVLGRERITLLAAYVTTLRGTHVAGKPPEGVKPQ